MKQEDYILYLKSIVTTAQIDRLTDEALFTMKAQYVQAISELTSELNLEKKWRSGGRSVAEIKKRLNQLVIQSEAIAVVTNDVANLSAASGMIAFPAYNEAYSWNGRVEDFNAVTRNALELKEQAMTANLGGKKLPEWTATLFDSDAVIQSIESSRLQGLGYADMVDKLRSEFGDEFEHDLTTIARSYTQAMNVEAQVQTAAANKDVVGSMEWLAVLENGNFTTGRGTCPRCAALDGNVYPIDDIEAGRTPKPILHPRCRCILSPVTKTWKELGFDVEELDDVYRPWTIRTEEAIAAGGRRDILDVGQFDGNYSQFWSVQDEAFQNAAIGIQRARLVRDQRIDFKDIINANGDLIPIVNLGLDDAALYFARTGKILGGGGGGTAGGGLSFKPKPPDPAPVVPGGSAAEVMAKMDTIGLTMLNDKVLQQMVKDQAALKAKREATMEKYMALDPDDDRRPGLMKQVQDTAILEIETENKIRDYRKDIIDTTVRPPAGGKPIEWSQYRSKSGRRIGAKELKQNEETWNLMFKDVEKMFAPAILDRMPPVDVKFRKGARGHYANNPIFKNYNGRDYIQMGERSTRTLVHEFGHHVEWNDGLYEKLNDFLMYRKGDELLSGIYGSQKEIGYKDKFFKHYVGRVYPHELQATEILSMGVERMYFDPLGFYNEDPEYFEFIIKAIWDEL